MSFIKPVFGDSKVKWSLASFKAQPGPGSSLPFSFVAPATLPTSSLTSSPSFRFPGARVRPQVSQAHTRQGPKQVQGPGPCCAPHRAGHDPLAWDAARAPGTQTHVISGAPKLFWISMLLQIFFCPKSWSKEITGANHFRCLYVLMTFWKLEIIQSSNN